MTRSDDRRVRRTRTALVLALRDLMIEKGYDAVTVQDLIDRADVGRSTFYAHFTDKSDLLHETVAGLRDLLVADPADGPPDRRHPLPFSLRMFRHVRDQRELMTALLGRPGGGAVLAEIEQILLEVARADLGALAAGCGPGSVPPDLLAEAVVASFLATLRWWVREGFGQGPEELERMFRTIVAPGVRAALPPGPPGLGDRAGSGAGPGAGSGSGRG